MAVPPPPEPPGASPGAASGGARHAAPTASSPVAASAGIAPVSIEVAPAPEPRSVPTLRIVSPTGGAALGADAAEAAPIEVETSDFDPREHRLILVLDDGAAMLVETPERLPSLTSLGPIASEGEHRLAVCVTDREGRALRPSRGPAPAASVRFFVGESAPSGLRAGSGSEVLGVPLTRSGEALVVDYYAMGDALDGVGVELSVSPPDGRVYRATSPARAPFLVRGLPVGRSKLRLQLVDASGRWLDDSQPVVRIVEGP